MKVIVQSKLLLFGQWITRVQTNHPLYQIIQRSLTLLFPFVLIGSLSQLIQLTLFNRHSFIASIFHFSTWLTKHNYMQVPFNSLTSLTLGIVAAIAAFATARYTAKYYGRDEQLASITGLVAYLLLALRYTPNGELTFNANLLGMGALFFGLLVGYLVGLVFRWLGKAQQVANPHNGSIVGRSLDSLVPISLVVVTAILVGLLLNWLEISILPDQVILKLQNLKANQTSLIFSLGIGVLVTILTFFGLTSMPTLEQFGRDGFAATANLNYAFLHHTPWHVPYPFTLGTLYGPFGAIGGTGGTLALVIAIFLFSRQRDQHLIGHWSLMPVLFNFNSAVLTGLPVLGNGLYIIPFLLVPLVNMGIAALAIALNLMPAVVYNVPLGTPGLLQAFIGTNGNWMALVISLLNVFVGVLIYKPFIQLANRLQEGVDQDV